MAVSLLNIVATFGLVRARERGSVEKRGSNRMSTDFFGTTVLVREADFKADFFTEPVDKLSCDFRGSVAVDDDRFRSIGIH